MLDKKILSDWDEQHWRNIVLELREARIDLIEENIPLIVEETSFRVRSRKHPKRCPVYYKAKTPCHPQVKDLNCLVCACPQYLLGQNGGGCRINSPNGFYYKNEVWDCTNCSYGHTPKYAEFFLRQNLSRLRAISEATPTS